MLCDDQANIEVRIVCVFNVENRVYVNLISTNVWVCLPADAAKTISIPLKFALPGKERQDSVYSGLQVLRVRHVFSF